MDDTLATHILGALTQIEGQLARLLDDLESARTRGAVDHFERLAWSAGALVDYDHRGVFAGLAVRNETAGDVFVGLAPGAGTAERALLTLPAHSWVCLPVRGASVSVGGAAAGSVLVALFLEPPPFGAGPTG
jgi:hypothetical protein